MIHGDDYDATANDEILLAVQIETDEGAANAKEILSVDGIDGCWIGHGNLFRYMGLDLSTPEGRIAHMETIRKVIADCNEVGKIPGSWTGTAQDANR